MFSTKFSQVFKNFFNNQIFLKSSNLAKTQSLINQTRHFFYIVEVDNSNSPNKYIVCKKNDLSYTQKLLTDDEKFYNQNYTIKKSCNKWLFEW